MAIDAYLQIEGIKGESTDDKHKDWIECVRRGLRGRSTRQPRVFDRWWSYDRAGRV